MYVTLEEAVDSLAPRLLKYCRAKVGHLALAEEVAQDALTALVVRWRRVGAPDSPDGFAFAVARRQAWRGILRQRMLMPVDVLLQRRDGGPNPEQAVVFRRQWRDMSRALRGLKRGEREALLLVTLGELDGATAAKALGISPAALKMRVMRSRRHLRERMEDSGEPGQPSRA
jgi:RNA polymerase sigma factor (sigma-70 family)